MKAFSLIKGEPFKGMYDNWSDYMRAIILSRFEKDVLSFIEKGF
ncbi:MAG: hypothetical protein ABDH37_03610 [Candidatus Hydrothermales bacterium]